MPAYLRRLGWTDKSIILIDMDAGVSGMKRIDERDGMRQLFELISERKVRTVACQDEDRLFRDVTQIQVNIFIEACRQAKVLVITPSMIYNFADERNGSFHARQFRFKSEMAAEYISAVILGKMNRAKKRLMLEGRWAGAPVVPGYIVDNRKSLPNGQSNPNWRRYVPFAPHSEVVREYFRIFLGYAGNVHATLQHIHERGPYYPDPEACPIPEGFVCVHQRKRYAKGYCPGRTGLEMLLTNAMVIGHWTVNGSIVIWNNHEPIVDEPTFWLAFNYLSSITLEGKPNPNYKPFAQQARPSLEKERPVERPLFAGMIDTEHNNKLQKVGTVWIKDRAEYIYCFSEHTPMQRILWRRNAHFIDQTLIALVLDKLRATFAPDVWERSIANISTEHEVERRRLQSQITALEQVKRNLTLSLEVLSNPDMIRETEARYSEAEQEHKRLQQQLVASSALMDRVQALEQLRETIEPTVEHWDSLERETKLIALHTFISRINARAINDNATELTVHWIEGTTTSVILPKQMKTGWRSWLDEETEQLLTLVRADASQVEIAAAFPHRTWQMIRDKIASELGKGVNVRSPRPMREKETYDDFCARVQKTPTSYRASSSDFWSIQELETLSDLIDGGHTQIEILSAFPHRRWLAIEKKIRKHHPGVQIELDKQVKRHDSIEDVRKRAQPIVSEDADEDENSGGTQGNEGTTSSSGSSIRTPTRRCWDSASSSRWTRPGRTRRRSRGSWAS